MTKNLQNITAVLLILVRVRRKRLHGKGGNDEIFNARMTCLQLKQPCGIFDHAEPALASASKPPD